MYRSIRRCLCLQKIIAITVTDIANITDIVIIIYAVDMYPLDFTESFESVGLM